jgi:outer membrane protein assembly factor BamB
MIYADRDGRVFAVVNERYAARVYGLDGAALGPWIASGFRSSFSAVAVAPGDSLVVLGNFERGTVKAFDWRSGEPRWEIRDGFKKLCGLSCHGKDELLASQLDGGLTALRLTNGEVLARDTGVLCHDSASGTRRIALLRAGRGRQVRRLEFVDAVGGAPACGFDSSADSFDLAPAGDLAVVGFANSLLRCFDVREGKELWRVDLGVCAQMHSLAAPPGAGVVCGVRWEAEAVTGRFVEFDLRSGAELRSVPAAAGLGEVLDGGRAAVWLSGVVSLPGLEKREYGAELRA